MQREVNQVMEVFVCRPHSVTVLRGWKLHGTQSRGAAVSGQTSLSNACAVVATVALYGKSGCEVCILGGGGTRHPMPPFHPEVTKRSAGQAGTGAEAAAPCKICSITPRRKGEKGWEGREEADF